MTTYYMSKYTFPVVIITLIFLLFGIIEAKSFLYPIAFGVLLAYLLYPIANFFEKHGFPRILAIILSIVVGIGVLLGIFFFIYTQILMLVKDFPVLKSQALSNLDIVHKAAEELLQVTNIQIQEFLKQRVALFFERGGEIFNVVFSATTGTLVKLGLMPVYVFLFLYYRTKFAYFILKLVPEEKERTTIQILRSIAEVIPRYMGGVLMVVFTLFFINSFGLFIIDVKYPITFGVLSALFNIIPYFGTLLGGIIPLLFTILTGTLPADPLKVVLLFIVIQFTENNILTPNIVGGNVKISPFFIILGLVASSMIWGVAGMLVIVPFLAVLRIVFSHIPALYPWAFLLGTGGTRKYALSLRKIKNWFMGK